MKKLILLNTLLLLTLNSFTSAQSSDSLKGKLLRIIDGKKAKVGVAVQSFDGKDTLSINGDEKFPMQSVYKYHLALAVLNRVDKGEFSLDQDINISKEDVTNDLYSPIREKYPDGTTMKLSDVLRYTISESDNVGCDVLLRLIGGPETVEKYLKDNGVNELAIVYDEKTQQSNWENQFRNWTTPKAANLALVKFYENENHLLSQDSYNFLWDTMKGTKTGRNSIKGELPSNTIVAHKTGHSGTNEDGVTAAVNDIGIVSVPNGEYFYLSVFVSNSSEDEETNQKIIADIAKATWDYFMAR